MTADHQNKNYKAIPDTNIWIRYLSNKEKKLVESLEMEINCDRIIIPQVIYDEVCKKIGEDDDKISKFKQIYSNIDYKPRAQCHAIIKVKKLYKKIREDSRQAKKRDSWTRLKYVNKLNDRKHYSAGHRAGILKHAAKKNQSITDWNSLNSDTKYFEPPDDRHCSAYNDIQILAAAKRTYDKLNENIRHRHSKLAEYVMENAAMQVVNARKLPDKERKDIINTPIKRSKIKVYLVTEDPDFTIFHCIIRRVLKVNACQLWYFQDKVQNT